MPQSSTSELPFRRRAVRSASLMTVGLVLGLTAAHLASGQSAPEGQAVFRFDTFGDEQHWTDVLRLHEVIESSVSPRAALAVGLKVDADALPPNFLATLDLDAPRST